MYAPFRCPTKVGFGLTIKHYTRLERFVRNKHSSLIRAFIYYGQKKFHHIGPWMEVSDTDDNTLAYFGKEVIATVTVLYY
jgi:hypothetical protein